MDWGWQGWSVVTGEGRSTECGSIKKQESGFWSSKTIELGSLLVARRSKEVCREKKGRLEKGTPVQKQIYRRGQAIGRETWMSG